MLSCQAGSRLPVERPETVSAFQAFTLPGLWQPACVRVQGGIRPVVIMTKSLERLTSVEPHLRILHTLAQAVGRSLDVDEVLTTALDALQAGLEVVVLVDATRPVDVQPGDGARALAEITTQGARLARSSELIP